MRKALIGTAILVMTAGPAIRAQDQSSPLDAPTTLRLPASLPACGVDSVLLALARTSHVMTGFEEGTAETTACRGHFARVDVTYVDRADSSVTVREVLDQLVTLASDYQWTDMDGVAVIRPLAAWTDARNVLNSRVPALHMLDATVGDTLGTILRRPTHNPRLARVNFGKPAFAMAFDGGTMMEALNALVRSREGLGWMARALPPTGGDGTPAALQLAIRTFNVGDRSGVDGALMIGMPISRLIDQ
jgi:hypothetical protein